jgi:hypothetical protein
MGGENTVRSTAESYREYQISANDTPFTSEVT